MVKVSAVEAPMLIAAVFPYPQSHTWIFDGVGQEGS